MKAGYPEIIFIVSRWKDGNKNYLNAALNETDAKNGLFGLFTASRAIPYTDTAWLLCQEYKKRRASIEDEYVKLLAAAKRVPPNNGLQATPNPGSKPATVHQPGLFE